MTLAEINLISSKGQATPGKLYYDDNGKVYIGLKSGRIVRYIPTEQVTTNVVTDTATTTTTGVTSVDIKAGAGISVTGTTPITSAGSVTVINTAPDQTVVLTPGTGIGITGTYPNFTITNSSPSSGGTVTSITAGAGLSGGTITTSGTVSIDYTNGQSASSSNKGFLTSTDWNTFNDKPSTNITYSVIATF